MSGKLIDTLDADGRRALDNVRGAAARIWSRPLHRTYTDHTVAHSERVIALLDGLAAGAMATDERLSPAEILILLTAAYLHDIGMQNEKFAGGDLEEIRAGHNEQTAEMIYAVFEDPANAFPIPLARDPAFVEAVALVARGHRRVDLDAPGYEPLFDGGERLRLRLLAALLRFADELDVDYRRVDVELMKLLALPVASQLHWWKCHYVGGVSIVDGYIRVSYRFPRDRPDYKGLIVPLVETEIRRKLAGLEEILWAGGVKVALGKPQVRAMRLVEPLPPEVEALARRRVEGDTQEDTLEESPVAYSRQSFEPEMVVIPAGEFLMGSEPARDEHAYNDEQLHRVYVSEFYIGRYPVTNAQYAAFTKATQCRTPEHWERGKIPPDKEKHPIVNVEWYEALHFCEWLSQETGRSYRLPTEAEWEKAARGTDDHLYPWGDSQPTVELCNFNHNVGDTTPVGDYSRQGDSPYGCADMAGNVWEWTQSLKKDYPYDPTDGRENLMSDGKRVARGGAFNDKEQFVRCAYRYERGPRGHYPAVGFRVAVCHIAPTSRTVQDEEASSANLGGSGVAARDHSVAAGAGSVAIGRDVRGDALTGTKTPTFDQRGQQVGQQFNIAGDFVVHEPPSGAPVETGRRDWEVWIAQVTAQLDTLSAQLGEGVADLKCGQAALYRQVARAYRDDLARVLAAVQQGRLEQGEMRATLDALRRAMRAVMDQGLPMDDELRAAVTDLTEAVESSLSVERKLELALPLLPLLTYKIELGVGSDVDLHALWDDIRARWNRLVVRFGG